MDEDGHEPMTAAELVEANHDRGDAVVHPIGDVPGMAVGPGAACSREDARLAVGPGWQALVDRALELVAAQGAVVVQIKEQWAALRVYCAGADVTLAERIQEIAAESRRVCEACGEPGETWSTPNPPPRPLDRSYPGDVRWMTLCRPCAFRYYALGVRGWPAIAGGLDADDR